VAVRLIFLSAPGLPFWHAKKPRVGKHKVVGNTEAEFGQKNFFVILWMRSQFVFNALFTIRAGVVKLSH
jgi:hypothetical protein